MTKTITVFFSLLFLVINCFSQGWVHSKVINSNDLIEPRYSVIDQFNNKYVLASFKGTLEEPNIVSIGNADLLLIKFNPGNDILWYKQIGGTGIDNAGSLILNNDQIIVIVNFQNIIEFTSTESLVSKGGLDVGMCKFNTLNGDYIESILIGTSDGVSDAQAVLDAKIHNSTMIVAGNFTNQIELGANKVKLDAEGFNTNFIAQLDLDGNVIWAKKFLSSTNNCKINKVSIAKDGYYFGGFYRGNMFFDIGTISSYTASYNDNFLYKTSFEGTGQWIRRIFGSETENIQSLTTDDYNNIYILGNYGSPTLFIDSTAYDVRSYPVNKGNFDTYILKFNRSGVLQWSLLKGSAGRDIYNDFIRVDSTFYTTGYFSGEMIFNDDTLRTSSINNSEAFFASFNEKGDPISGSYIIGSGNFEDAGYNISVDKYSDADISGYFRSSQVQIGDQIFINENPGSSDFFTVKYHNLLKAVITAQKMVSCNGLNDGMLRITPYFGKSPFTYSWSHDPGLNSPVAENLSAGDYTVTVRDANNNVASITGHVAEPSGLIVQSSVTPVSCFNEDDGAIDITVSGGTPGAGYKYFWSSTDGSGIVPLNEDQSNLTKGTYTVKVEDVNKCNATVDIVVTEPAPFNYAGSIVNDITIPPGGNGSITLNLTGGTTPYNFSWSGPGGFTSSSKDISNLAEAGLYSLSITDNKGCSSDTVFALDDELTLIAQISKKTDVLCFGANNGSATVSIINGTPPYEYQWSDGVTLYDAIRTGMEAKDYVVTVKDGSGKTAQASVTINSPSLPLNLTLNSENLRCNNDNSGVVDLSVSGGTLPYSFSWNTGYKGEDLVNVPAATYTVNVTDGNGCTEQGTREVFQPEALGLIITTSGENLCHGDRIVDAIANATGGSPPGSYSYLWDDPGTQTTQIAYDLGAGTWRCKVTDGNNCSITGEITILEPEKLSVTAVLENPSCAGFSDGSIIPTPSGGTGTGYEYVWSNKVYQRFNTNIPAGEYILTLNDANNCVLVETFTLSDPEAIVIESVIATDPICYGQNNGSIEIVATGGYGSLKYSIDGGANYVPGPAFSSLPADDYHAVVRDENACTSEILPITLDQGAQVSISSIEKSDITCFGSSDGSITITASGGSGAYRYSVDGGANFVPQSIIGSLAHGNYNVVVKDANECLSDIQTVTINNAAEVRIASIEKSDITCSDLSNGAITITAAGGTGNYSYSVDGGSSFVSESIIGSLAQGDYYVAVKDDNECLSEVQTVTINNAAEVKIASIEKSDITCFGSSDGSIKITAAGGTGTYSYSVDGGANFVTQSIIGSLAHGDYDVVVKDANECLSEVQTVTINNAAEVRITNVETSDVTCFGSSDGSIKITATGGSGTYSYSVNGGNSFIPQSSIASLGHGDYDVIVKDENGCLSEVQTVTINNADEVRIVNIETSDITCSDLSNGAITITAAGGTGNYSYSIDGGNSYVPQAIIGSLAQGDYDVIVKDENECLSEVQTVTINNVGSVRIVNIETSDQSCSEDGSITITAEGGSGNYSYSVDGGSSFVTESIIGTLAQGDYNVVVKDDNECLSEIQTVTINNVGSVRIVNIETSDLSCSEDGSITITAEGGSGNYSYSVDGGSSYFSESIIGSLAQGDYNVVVKDENECLSDIQTVTINNASAVRIVNIETSDLSCSENGSITITAEGGSGNYSYSIDGGSSFVTESIIGSLAQGDYNVVVKDENECLSEVQTVTINNAGSVRIVNIEKSDQSCSEDGSITITAEGGSGNYSYSIDGGNSFVTESFIGSLAQGDYNVVVKDENECLSEVQTVTINNAGLVRILNIETSDQSCSEDGSIAITAEGGSGNYSYSIDGGNSFVTESFIGSLAQGDYNVVVKDENECLSEVQTVTINNVGSVRIVNIETSDQSCSEDGSIAITAEGGSGNYSYSIDGGNSFVTESFIGSLAQGDYNVVVKDENECLSEVQTVTINNAGTVRIVSVETSDLSCSGIADGSITITAEGGSGNYSYSIDGGSSFETESTIGSLEQGDYEVVVKDENDCLSDVSNVTLVKEDVCGLIIYGGFSPNKDGKNDDWNIGNVENFPNIKVTIFNIWGKIVFSSNGYGTPWDGTFNGNELPAGTYYYVIDPGDGSGIITGDVSLVK